MLKKIKSWFAPPIIVFRVNGCSEEVKQFRDSAVAKELQGKYDVVVVNEGVTGIFFVKEGDNYGG